MTQTPTAATLQWVEDENFFREWQDNLPEITGAEKQRLDRVEPSYSNLLRYPRLLENTVNRNYYLICWHLVILRNQYMV